MKDERKREIMNSFIKGIPKAQADETRPLYHFHAPSQWMDDPNGIIYYQGYYHLMYSCNPFSDSHRAGPEYKQEPTEEEWGKPGPHWNEGITGWGHARSKDLIHWEHLPMALYPSEDQGEFFCWFGSTMIRKDQTPICFYTSIGKKEGPIFGTTQWAATGSSDLMQWEKVTGNPVMPRSTNPIEVMRWCDPHVFTHGEKVYCLIGGKLDDPVSGVPVICLYEALNDQLTSWKYNGIVFRHPNHSLRSMECPNIFEMNGKWVLMLSPHGPLEYWVGQLNFETCHFEVEKMGYLDRGTHLYASNYMRDAKQRILLWAAIEGFSENVGWRGCLCLPRVLKLKKDNTLCLQPAEELAQLRKNKKYWPNVELCNGWHLQDEIANTAEIIFQTRGVKPFSLSLCNGRQSVFSLSWNGTHIGFGKEAEAFEISQPASFEVQILIDRTVIEVFINHSECYTGVIPSFGGRRSMRLEGEETLEPLEIFELDASDIFTYSYGTWKDGRFISNGKEIG